MRGIFLFCFTFVIDEGGYCYAPVAVVVYAFLKAACTGVSTIFWGVLWCIFGVVWLDA